MSHKNGAKQFLYVVRHEHKDVGEGMSVYLIRSDHDPDSGEIVKACDLDYDEMHDDLEVMRYSEDEIPTLPPKKS